MKSTFAASNTYLWLQTCSFVDGFISAAVGIGRSFRSRKLPHVSGARKICCKLAAANATIVSTKKLVLSFVAATEGAAFFSAAPTGFVYNIFM